MSFNVSYGIVLTGGEVGKRPKPSRLFFRPLRSYLPAHSETNAPLWELSASEKLTVLYERQFKPFEISILNKLPWLSRYYPLHHRTSIVVYEAGKATGSP
jgi:hypothetical protein